ncbi:hypothetical protein ACFSJU_14570 [Paradesertivirga mongoliensis]|uniref:Uncharacterized protein n=1 Tax=Paradesertivirga mongoliensis TaxID=2100740 RepID=A0ABW4ZP52_9SPHI|nr:hypothetical protein [Pedobacter mongoliensis]
MKPFFLLIAVLSVFSVSKASAQVYIFAREDKADIVQVFNVEDGGTKILKQVSEKEGKWISLLETDTSGHGAIFCVANPEGENPKYFYSVGKANPADAIVEAREKAQEYSKGRSNLNVFIMRTFNNQNKYPLKRTTQ